MNVSPMADSSPSQSPPNGSLAELAKEFLGLGFVAFGGPAAHIAMMEERFVRRLNWLTRERFLDLLGAVNLLPGPSSTELAIYLGEMRAGTAGLLIAGGCFILPALSWSSLWHGLIKRTAPSRKSPARSSASSPSLWP